MEREVKITSDNSKTLYIKDLDECYHSHHGALQEAKHVFIKNGLNRLNICELNILELGFGTGLNVLVTIDEFLKSEKIEKINYFTIEKYPISESEIEAIDHYNLFDDKKQELKKYFNKIHSCNWNEKVSVLENFHFRKFNIDFFEISSLNIPPIDLVYFDCFGARVQPDLWEKPLFEIITNKMNHNCLLTTYSSKGSVRRVLQDLNFKVEKLEGPKGKREMINAWKQD